MLDQLKTALAKAKDLSYNSLKSILENNLPEWEEIAQFVTYGEPYGRNELFRGDGYEVMIGSWSLGNWCAAHDHGPAVGLCYGYSGEVEHCRYAFNETEIAIAERSYLRAGQFAELTAGMIHALANVRSEIPYVGLHIYTPATQNVRVFDLNKGDIYHVTDDHGAWVPTDPSKIRKIERQAFKPLTETVTMDH